MFDIIIIGAGVAGLTSAIYALCANKKVLILEKDCYGGQIINAHEVRNYPGFESINGYDLATNIYNQVNELNGEIRFEEVISISNNKEVITNKNKYNAKTIIIATGSKSRKLNLLKEEKLLGKGISYCATCDGNFYKNKDVMVVGGGSTALTDAIYLSDICNKIYLVHRRDEFRGEESLQKNILEKDNIKIIYNSTIKSINGEEYLESVDIINNNDEVENIKVDGLFVAIGQQPDTNNLKNVIDVDKYGYIISSEDCHTNIDGIFVAGDIRSKNLRQLTTAVSDGSIAATEAIKYINTKY